jgi:phosphate transport system substrate-binding protein
MASRILLIAALATVAVTGAAQARDQIRIVGSSTVFPFATAVAERFGKKTRFKTPIIESTGSGGGLKLFCQGVGAEFPDITNSSRRIKKSEVDNCARNGVREITEVKIGFDGIVIANSRKGPAVNLTRRQIWLALAKTVPAGATGATLIANPYRKWSDIDGSLPNEKIEVLGPPPTSGTRDAFVELAMDHGCETFPAIKAMAKTDKNRFRAVCRGIREDGGYIEAGENDVLIVQKLVANPAAFGIFGFSFLDQSRDKIQGAMIEGTRPEFELIASGRYPISRSLYFYVKKAHAAAIPGMKEYVDEFTGDRAVGDEGYLADKGLIPLPRADRSRVRKAAMGLSNLNM